ncbi:hypothetical protein HYN48_05025 [Flavobacterium magnum]|uniref:Uncharacterized protein n=1 Tax=Flavobacterium magnum TaxID=2162713 RepID=A0A2S0RDY0_9FLAO|nr:glycosyltransferase [Flavobacterium magnum]AWA29500.1 hypothetical protein HYN48_05025 [Flavobacterium magnum]
MAQNYHSFLDISVYNRDIKSVQEEIDFTPHSLGYLDYLDKNIDYAVIRFGACAEEKPPYFLYRYRFSDLLRLYRLIKSKKNAVALFHGFSFPFRFYLMRAVFGRKVQWIVQHHAGEPSENRLKRFIQRKCYALADRYFFVSRQQAESFIAAGLVSSADRVIEVMECSTAFVMKDKTASRVQLAIDEQQLTFLWVGNLDSNKDPLCMLRALAHYRQAGYVFELYMFFVNDLLLQTVVSFIDANDLGTQVHLKGKVPNAVLEDWFNAADFFISCSHSEGSGVAMAEAMACGCVPIVSDIPAFIRMTGGKTGVIFETGNPDDLFEKLMALDTSGIEQRRAETRQAFVDSLSFEAIARDTAMAIAGLSQK